MEGLELFSILEPRNTEKQNIIHKIISLLKGLIYEPCTVGIALGYELDDRGSRVRFPAGLGMFLFTTASRQLWGPPSLLPNG
jgi:hypothetical protein